MTTAVPTAATDDPVATAATAATVTLRRGSVSVIPPSGASPLRRPRGRTSTPGSGTGLGASRGRPSSPARRRRPAAGRGGGPARRGVSTPPDPRAGRCPTTGQAAAGAEGGGGRARGRVGRRRGTRGVEAPRAGRQPPVPHRPLPTSPPLASRSRPPSTLPPDPSVSPRSLRVLLLRSARRPRPHDPLLPQRWTPSP